MADNIKYLKLKLVLASLSLVLAGAYVAWFWYDHFYCTPTELYHRTWKACQDNIFDPAALKNWQAWEHKFDDQIKTDKDAVEYTNKMLLSTGDPYTYLLDTRELEQTGERREGKFVGLGIGFYTADDFKSKENKLLKTREIGESSQYLVVKYIMEDSPAERAGVRQGDTIIGIAGRVAKGMTAMQLSAISRGRQNIETPVTIKRNGRVHRLLVVPAAITVKNVEQKKLAHGVGYLRIRDFIQKDTPDNVANGLARLNSCKSLVIDLRNNPGGSVGECLETASLFMNTGKLVTLKVRQTAGSYYTETFSVNDKFIVKNWRDNSGLEVITRMKRRYSPWQSRPIVVLINRGTASCAEMFAACLKDNGRARLVGTTTLGKGIAQAHLPMPNGTALSISCVRYFTPNGSWLGSGRKGHHGTKAFNHEGLKPNVRIKAPKKYDTAGNDDVQFEKAFSLLAPPHKIARNL